MARIPISWTELHAPLFMNGKNFSPKIDCKKLNISMWYSTEAQIILAIYNGCVTIIGGPAAAYNLADVQDYKKFKDFEDFDITPYLPKSPERQRSAPQTPAQTPQMIHQAKNLRSAQVWDPSNSPEGLTKLQGAPKYRPHPTRSKPDPVPVPQAKPDPIPEPGA